MRAIIFDTETDGIQPDREACDVGLIEIDLHTLEELGRAEAMLKISKPISPEASAIHGITDDMLVDKPTVHEWVTETFGGRLEGDVVLIGHRVDFDLPMFAPIGDAKWTVDTLLLSQLFLNVTTENRKLDTLKAALGLPGGGISHRAMADCMTCHQLLQHLMPLTGRSLIDIATTEVFMLHEMPWGKHEGKPLMKVPRKYREWLMGLDNLDKHLRYSLEQVALADIPLPKPGSVSTAPRRIFIPTRSSR